MPSVMEKIAFSPLSWPIIQLTGNAPAQRVLAGVFHVVQHLMGIGPGAHVGSSGEAAAVRLMLKRGVGPFCVFDVGANQGDFAAMVFARTRDKPVAVHCFEPSRHTFGLLSSALAKQTACTLNNAALGATPGTAMLYFDAPGSELASLSRREMDHHGKVFSCSEEVRVDTVDGYCSAHGIGHIDMLKLDVEGHEMDVLSGAENMFAARKVSVCTFEFGAPNIDSRTYFRDLYRFFERHNMAIWRITRSGYLFPIARYHEKHEQFRTTNYIASARG